MTFGSFMFRFKEKETIYISFFTLIILATILFDSILVYLTSILSYFCPILNK